MEKGKEKKQNYSQTSSNQQLTHLVILMELPSYLDRYRETHKDNGALRIGEWEWEGRR